jgi:hypothetical protein
MHSRPSTVTDGVSSQLHVPHCAFDRTLGGSLISGGKRINPCRELIAGRAALNQSLTD